MLKENENVTVKSGSKEKKPVKPKKENPQTKDKAFYKAMQKIKER